MWDLIVSVPDHCLSFYLGIIMDKTLGWDKQVDSVCLNITRRITLLKQLSKYISKNCLKQYYNSYILPVF